MTDRQRILVEVGIVLAIALFVMAGYDHWRITDDHWRLANICRTVPNVCLGIPTPPQK